MRPDAAEALAEALLTDGRVAPVGVGARDTLRMIEPTESETKGKLDRFCDAMLAIREEIRAIEDGRADRANNPLKNAPHTVMDPVGAWERPYSREAACFPAGTLGIDKYWPPVNRVDNAYGDRNLMCSCSPVESYASAAE